jgi:hypothetical protein
MVTKAAMVALVKLVTLETITSCFAGGFAAYMMAVAAKVNVGPSSHLDVAKDLS